MSRDLNKALNAFAIVGFSTLSATIYGVLHDEITVRICREYFTVFHPLIFGEQSSTMLALAWGIVATWWVGAFLGVLIAVAACYGQQPIVQVRTLVLPITKLLGIMAISAAVAGVLGYFLIASKTIILSPIYAQRLSPNMYARFSADAWAHNASYLVGLLGGSVMVVNIWKSRHREPGK